MPLALKLFDFLDAVDLSEIYVDFLDIMKNVELIVIAVLIVCKQGKIVYLSCKLDI